MSTPAQQPSVCSEPLLFSFNDLGSRQVIADFSAGYLSSDGGMLLLRQIDEGLGISRSLAGCFYDARNPLLIEHSVLSGGRRTRSLRIDLDMLVVTVSPARTALKNSQLIRPRPDETKGI